MALPFVGEAIGPLVGSATALGRIALLVSEVGNAATTIADIVKNPDSAPFAILGLILSSVPVSGEERLLTQDALGRATMARKQLKAEDFDKYTQSFKDKDALIQTIGKAPSCRKK